VSALAGGDHLIWIGAPAALPADLWVGAFRPVEGPVALSVPDSSPLPMQQVFHRAAADSAYLKPVKEMPYHNQDEELRADLEPLLEARDRFGQVVGYPAVLMRHYAPSFVRRRFDGGEHFFFLLDRPSEALDDQAWAGLLATIAMRLKTGLELARTGADYASYRSGERVTARAVLRNVGPRMAAGTLRFLAKAPGEREFRAVQQERRLPDAGGSSEAIASFVPHGPPGLWSLRVELLADPAHLTEPAVAGRPVLIDRRDTGFIVLDSELRGGPRISFDGPRIRIDGSGGFLTGTNYYPSSSWWEWLWRDFRPLAAVEDFASMRRTGYRIVRIWAEPELDETTLRAMDAAIYLAGRAGLVVDLCLFTQWVRTMAFENPNHDRIRFDFRGPRDFNIYGISLRNLEWQRGYAASLARRWRSAENLVFNLANETYVNDPDRSQMDPKALQWPGIPASPGVLRDSLLFRAWAREIVAAIRETGAKQPVIPGYIFAEMKGGDAYLAQRDGEIAAWHSYSNFDHTAAALSYVDPHSSGRPMLLEEMGTTGWNRPEVYDALA
ncbi:MAG TPA: hypothetical protein VG672_06350, partial [Bryobacteraceae bacterium]|nr:hypothetical protein [Bryobacteraceae bacterium]